jgi:hypothetical protein
VDTVNGRIGVNNTEPRCELHVEGEDTISAKFKRRDKGGSGDSWSAVEIVTSNQTGNSRLVLNGPATEGQGAQNKASCTLDYEHQSNVFSIYNGGNRRFLIEKEGNVAIDTTTFYVDAENNNVGIGTVDPEVRLHVKGSSGDGRIMIESQGQARLDFKSSEYGSGPGANVNLITQKINGFGNCFSIRRFGTGPGKINVSMDENSNNIVNIIRDKVGIGTLDPVNPLDVTVTVPINISGPEANSFPLASFRALQTGTADQRGLEIGAPPGGIPEAPVYLKVRGTSARFAILNDSNVENFTLTNDRLVGIGTATPFRKLHIKNDGTGPTGNSKSATMLALHDARSNANTVQQSTVISFRNPIYSNHIITSDFFESSAIQHRMLNSNVDTAGGVTTSLSFFTCENAQDQRGLVSFLNIVGSKVGIGNPEPAAKLHIIGDENPSVDIDNPIPIVRLGNSNVDAQSNVSVFFALARTTDGSVTDGAYIRAGKNGQWDSNSNRKSFLSFATRDQSDDYPEEKMRIMNNGNVGIGMNDPPDPLVVKRDFNLLQPMIVLKNDDLTDNNAVSIDFSGKRSSDLSNIIYGRIGAVYTDHANRSGDIFFSTVSNGTFSEKLRIKSDGKVGIGTDNPAHQLELSTDDAAKLTTTTWQTTSDERVKSNVVDADLQTCYDIVKNLPLKRYKWNDKYLPNVEDHHMLGWIAQDVQKVLPKSIKTHSKTFVVGKELETDGDTGEQVEKEITETIDDFLSLDSDQIIKMLFGAVQALQKEVEELKEKVN